MPSYKLKGSCSKPVKPSHRHSKKLLVKQFGGGSIDKNILFELAINNTSVKGSENLEKLSDDVLTIYSDLSLSGYTPANLPQTKYVVIQQTKPKTSISFVPRGPNIKLFIVQIDPKPTTKANMNAYFIDKTDGAISLTAGFPVLKKLTQYGEDTLEYKKFKDEGSDFGDAWILDTDGREKLYKLSSLYKNNVIPEVKKYETGTSIATASGTNRAATPKELKQLEKMKSVLSHSALKQINRAPAPAPAAAAAAAPAAGAAGISNVISFADLKALFPGGLADDDKVDISNSVELIYDFSNHSINNEDNLYQMANLVKNKINGNEFYLAQKEKLIQTLKNDYYILKKFYGQDDILVLCVMPAGIDGNINLGTPEIYEDSKDLVVDFDGANYTETKKTFFNRSHVLLSCLKKYIKLKAEAIADQSKLDSYEDYYFSSAVPYGAKILQQHFYITPILKFNSKPTSYEFLYQKTTGSIFKIIYMKNSHNISVPVITYIYLADPNITNNIQNFFCDYVRNDDYVLKTLNYQTDPYPEFEEFNNPTNVSYIYNN
jgi:hypothetical protein